jgi:signal transduction histidine kinase
MLDLARTGAGKLRLDVSRIDLCRAVIDTVDERRAQFEERRQPLLLDMAAGPLWIDADAGRVGQIVANLLDNAQKFTPDGGQVSVSVTSTPPHATLQVCDSGVGIPAHRLEAIFDHFAHFDGHPSHSRGLGLGLTLARRLAELSGGRLTASSDGPDHGSCFMLRLPLAGAVTAEH